MKDLAELVLKFQARVEKNYWVEIEDGTKVERWKYYNTQRRIAQAACNYGGYIVTGTRHYCPLMHLQIDSVGKERLVALAGGYDNVIQGFTDQYGVFLTREEAYPIAVAAGQIIRPEAGSNELFSEHYV